ncbi:achaete-scute homolog 5-like [Chaetodon trifascialis]|uniref:achaete-scute homolog 5-like n=1 Tax=Chaetodon trifascialis TaxID=109706 RepID=UPI0039964071
MEQVQVQQNGTKNWSLWNPQKMSTPSGVSTGHMMSSTFSSSSYLSFSLSPPAAHREDRGAAQHSLSGSVPFLLYPSSMDPYKGPLRGPGPGILPYLAPFHHHGHFSVYECPFEPAFIQKRNERERQRVRCVNQGYAKLRDHLPGQSADKRLSKVETLRAAIRYIKYLQGLVELEDGRLNSSSPGPDCGGEC